MDLQSPTAPAFDLLHDIVGNGHRANRHAPMTKPGSNGKYYTVHKKLTDAQIAAHLLGEATYAVPLIGTDELVGGALIELDCDHLEGARRVQRAAAARNVTIVSIATHGALDHDGSHNWAFFADRVPPANARALMQQIAKDAGYPDAETWPNHENIRLPFGQHRWTGDWGITLLPTGEIFDNNNADERAAAAAAAAALPKNDAPPEVPKAEPRQLDKYTNLTQRTSTRRATGDEISAKIRECTEKTVAKFNDEHDIKALALEYGAKETRDGLACNCGIPHGHGTQLTVLSGNTLVSYSDRCRWAPHYSTHKATKPFALYVIAEYGGNFNAAVEAKAREYGFWFDARAARAALKADRQVDPPLTEPEPQRTQEQRDAYNAARREARHAETRAALDTIYDLVCNLDFANAVPPGIDAEAHGDRTRWLLAYLLTLAYDAGRLQVAPTNERIAADLDMCTRYVQYAFRELEATGVGKRQGGRSIPGQPNEAATWTFFRSPHLVCKPHQDAECTLSYKELDPVPNVELVSPPPPAQPEAWELWEAADLECSGYDLALECAAPVTVAILATVEPVEPVTFHLGEEQAMSPRRQPEPDQEPGGASYNPKLDWTAGGRFDPADWRDPTVMRLLPHAAGDAPPVEQRRFDAPGVVPPRTPHEWAQLRLIRKQKRRWQQKRTSPPIVPGHSLLKLPEADLPADLPRVAMPPPYKLAREARPIDQQAGAL